MKEYKLKWVTRDFEDSSDYVTYHIAKSPIGMFSICEHTPRLNASIFYVTWSGTSSTHGTLDKAKEICEEHLKSAFIKTDQDYFKMLEFMGKPKE